VVFYPEETTSLCGEEERSSHSPQSPLIALSYENPPNLFVLSKDSGMDNLVSGKSVDHQV
jgi:hypothetical protein